MLPGCQRGPLETSISLFIQPSCFVVAVVAQQPLQEVGGYVSVYAVMNRFGYTNPGKLWRQLLLQHAQTLPPHQMMQFRGLDGRNGRKIPAIHLRDLDRLILHFDTVQWQEDDVTFVRAAVEHTLQVMAFAFQEQEPLAQHLDQEHRVDLYLQKDRVALLYQPTDLTGIELVENEQTQAHYQKLGIVVIPFDPFQESFELGLLVLEVRKHIDQQVL